MVRAIVLLAAGCGAGSGPAPYDEAGFCADVVSAFAACCPGEGLDDIECRDRFFGPVREGRADVSTGDADECRSGYERAASTCGELTPTERAACDDLLVGHVPVGDGCPDPRLCAEGAVCVDETCVAEGEIGDDCVPFSCIRGLYCNVAEGICRDLRDEGDGCAIGEEAQCREDLRCVDNRCGDGLPDAAPCGNDAECESLACDASRCAPVTAATFCGS